MRVKSLRNFLVVVVFVLLGAFAAGFAYASPTGRPERCRSSNGRFAKCSAPGAVKASAYVRKCVRESRPCATAAQQAQAAQR